MSSAAGIDLAVLGTVVRHTDAITGGPGAIMWRGPLAASRPMSGRFDIFDIQLDAALRLGELDDAQLREIVIFVAHYAGWPTAATLNGRVEQLLAKRTKDAGS